MAAGEIANAARSRGCHGQLAGAEMNRGPVRRVGEGRRPLGRGCKLAGRLESMVNVYRKAMAVMGTFVAIAAAAVPIIYFAFIVLPFCIVLGYTALWLISGSRSVRVPITVAIVGTLGLIAPTVVYIGNEGNWNQPGTQWLLLPLLVGTVLLGANAFAIYVRHVASRVTALVGSAALAWRWRRIPAAGARGLGQGGPLYVSTRHALCLCLRCAGNDPCGRSTGGSPKSGLNAGA